MKKRYLQSIPVMLGMTLIAHADSGVEMSDCEWAEKLPCYEYHNRMSVFNPCHQAYERIQIDTFYAGVEVWGESTWSTDHGNKWALLGEAELRFGYNYFYNRKDHVTPFVGGGIVRDFRKEDHRSGSHERKPAVAYGVFGFLYDHEFNTIFNLGINFKGLIGGSPNKKHFDWGSPVGGIDVALPITFRFGNQRHWDIRIEPFDLYLHGKRISRNYFGFRSSVGYRF